jgi:uncharacterized DUF497 family protein
MRRLPAAELRVDDLGNLGPRPDDLASGVPAQGTDEVALVAVSLGPQGLNRRIGGRRFASRQRAGLGLTYEVGYFVSQRVIIHTAIIGKCRRLVNDTLTPTPYYACIFLTKAHNVKYCMTAAPPITIDYLDYNDDVIQHIARHDVAIQEVLEALDGDFLTDVAKHGRFLVLGVTEASRCLAIIVQAGAEPHSFRLITARTAHTKERRTYMIRKLKGEGDS